MSGKKQTSEEAQIYRDERLNSAIRPILAAIKPPENITVTEWADRNRVLSPETSAEVGPYRSERTPYLVGIMDAFTDSKVKHIVVGASSQVGKSEIMNNMVGYIIDQDPSSILFIQPTTLDAKDYSKLRIAPMIRDTKCLSDKVAESKSRDSSNTILQKAYPGGILTLCGSTEAHALCSKPIRYVFGDERDRWAVSAGAEGDPWALALKRQITFYNSKSVEVSTPTIRGASAIERAYLRGTMERWKSQCPHCGSFSEIHFENIKYTYEKGGEDAPYNVTSVIYSCPVCGGVSDELTMKHQPARWEADNPEALSLYGTRSFWISSWVSPWARWRDTIIEFLKARHDPNELQVVYNTLFGYLWENRGDIQDEGALLSRREDYKAELPDGVLLLTMGVDTQDDRLEYEVVGWGKAWENWSIKRGIIMGKPDNDDTWAALDDILDHIYTFADGVGLRISLAFQDENGHFTNEVRKYCRDRMAKKLFPCRGVTDSGRTTGMQTPFTSPPKKTDIVLKGKYIGECQSFSVGVDAGKHIIMRDLRVEAPGAKYCHFPRADEYDKAFFNGLLSERCVLNAKTRKLKWEKIEGHDRNEPLDCRNYALAAAHFLQPDFFALEQRLIDARTGKKVEPKKASAKKAKSKARKSSAFYDNW